MKKLILFIFIISLHYSIYSQNKYSNVVFETTEGNLVIQLYDETPLHCENFLKLIKDGYYNNQLFHRVINNFMIQSGDPNSISAPKGTRVGTGGPGYTIPAEFIPKYYHVKGALSAARQGDNINPKKESSGSQFFIVQGNIFTNQQLQSFVTNGQHIPFTDEQIKLYTHIGGTPHLDYQYTVFGILIEGFDVLDKIAAAKVDGASRPVEDIRILKAYTIKNK